MTATYQSIGTVGTGATSSTPGLPASLANGDLALIMAVAKPDTATINTPTGWTVVANVSGGGGTTGSFTGPTRQAWFSRVKDASWSTAPAVTLSSGQPVATVMARITLTGGGTYDVTAATGVYGTAAAVTNCAATLGSDPGITNGDLLLGGYSSPDNTATWSAEGASAPGVTIGAATERSEAVEFNSSGNVGGMLFTASATAGTSTGAPSTAATSNVTTRGTVALIRVREVTAAVQYPAAGTVAATSATTGTAAVRLTASGTVAGTTAATGTANAMLTASGTVAATSGTSGSATVIGGAQQLPAAGTVGATSAASGSAGVIAAASGTVTVTSDTIGAATAALAAAGLTVAQATATGSASALLDTSGSAEAVSGTSGSADVIVAVVEPPTPQRRIVSAVLTIPTLAADLEVPGSIAATLTAAGTLRADLTIPEARGVLT